MSEHDKELHFHHELPGLQESAAGDRVAEAASEAARAAAADSRASAHDAAKAILSSLTPSAARYLAERVQEATHGSSVLTYQRVLEAFEDLGVTFPAGTK